MPITKSAKKALKQDEGKRKRNIRYKNRVKDIRKKIAKLTAENKKGEAKQLLPSLYKIIDKAAKRGTINKHTASRIKSKETKSLNV